MTPTLTAPALLVPTDDPKPVDRAVVDGIVGDYPPEKLLWIIFRRPDGGSHVFSELADFRDSGQGWQAA
ncbi:hypothetical protein [Kitasatospora indigofera]|uniref:hypothetical protein n=1 Tax=Kitasatospora indigofera TaxID=67307 RepID=UPI003690FC33